MARPGEVDGCTSGKREPPTHQRPGEVDGCTSGKREPPTHQRPGEVDGCTSGKREPPTHQRPGEVDGCTSGKREPPTHQRPGEVDGCTSGKREPPTHQRPGEVDGCTSGKREPPTHQRPGEVDGCTSGKREPPTHQRPGEVDGYTSGKREPPPTSAQERWTGARQESGSPHPPAPRRGGRVHVRKAGAPTHQRPGEVDGCTSGKREPPPTNAQERWTGARQESGSPPPTSAQERWTGARQESGSPPPTSAKERWTGARVQVDDNLQQMQLGAVMRKVKSRSWKKQRYFKLQDDCMTIWYKSKKSSKTKSTFSISDIEAVREGHQSEVLQSIADEFPAERCFTIVFCGRRGNLDLIANSTEEAEGWVRGLRKLIETVTNMDQKEIIDQWICDWFQKADKNKDGRMNFKEVQDLLKMMNVDMNELHAYRLFQMADKSQSGTLEGEEFVFFYKALTQRDEVLKIFQEFSKDGKKLTLLEFMDFLHQEQLERDKTEEHALDLIARFEPSETAQTLHAMSIDGFLVYLCSPEGSIYNTEHRKLFQDMTQPLCHYFISSSHNTYLIEDQLRGQSSIEGYIRALKRGCRCVEVDCWDGPNGEPIVYHGHTFTSKIFFKDVIATINKYAFQVSDFPVILSIENHCGLEQQGAMAQHLKGILGEKLLTATLDGRIPAQLPSPEELKGKILLKGKKIGSLEVCLNGRQEDSYTGEVSEDEDGTEFEEETLRNEGKRKGKKSKQHLSKELSDCIIYCKSVPFQSFKHSRSQAKVYEMSSFTEYKAKKLLKDLGTEYVCHNTCQLSRIYPGGLRTDSSNFNPQEMWNVGCQIVAMNFQTAGVEMDLYDGLFSQNARCGYVLKPSFMRNWETNFNPDHPQDKDGYRPLNLSIQVISAQQLPKIPNSKEGSIVDPLVRVEIFGVPMDQAKQETKYIENNGFNPVWYETLTFRIHVPELALVRFVVEDYDKTSRNDFIGQHTLPFPSIKAGYRHVHLLSRDGNSIPPASLLVHVRITEEREALLPPAS
ncbi:1-phosphatidylinositol 4,5-bisphosphate phosphodiesterase delta-4 [Rhinatrema bivittatum]|uniref:1-phosphatidylinositol 4,5-bisphosphate phosphodiesterase delta-4 n=1 Tax=Rhinatrema bivittatum TaxID=194408 RepID=UPI00112DA438|nr:1-phosphatidylinositol 4,5-bisphosphate phosphodiesterase delta-4 [Rhinatrema bivittatum]